MYTLASNSLNNVKKLMFNPMANGTKPNIVVIAVNSTGRKRALPAFTILSYKSSHSR